MELFTVLIGSVLVLWYPLLDSSTAFFTRLQTLTYMQQRTSPRYSLLIWCSTHWTRNLNPRRGHAYDNIPHNQTSAGPPTSAPCAWSYVHIVLQALSNLTRSHTCLEVCQLPLVIVHIPRRASRGLQEDPLGLLLRSLTSPTSSHKRRRDTIPSRRTHRSDY